MCVRFGTVTNHAQVLCVRCSGLCNGAMIPAVEDFTQKQHAQVSLCVSLCLGAMALCARVQLNDNV